LAEVVKNAKMPQIAGVNYVENFYSELDHLFENGLQKGKTLGYRELDELITWETKRFCIVTGTPSSGKSEFVDFVATVLNLKHNWKVAFFSPENFPIKNHVAKLSEKIVGQRFSKEHMSYENYYGSRDYINENFFWVDPSESSDLESILDRFKFFIKAKGVKVIVLDPFNTIENEVKYNEQGKLLQKMVKFARANDVLFFLVAHPKKLEKNKEGEYPMPTMYDIAGSSDFWNMADYGISLRREVNPETKANLNNGILSVQKVKFKHLGVQGIWDWEYNFVNGRYISRNKEWDNRPWGVLVEEGEPTPTAPQVDTIAMFEQEPKKLDLKEINF
jgi:twinkle protein